MNTEPEAGPVFTTAYGLAAAFENKIEKPVTAGGVSVAGLN